MIKLFVLLLFPLSALASESALILWYTINEPEIEPYRMRYVVTSDFLRSDDGQDSDDFVLLDRKKKVIYNVVHESKSVLEIKGSTTTPAIPDTLKFDEKIVDAKDSPTIGGKIVKEYRMTIDDKACFNAMVLPGLYDDAANAFHEFASVLASQQERSLEHTPVEMLTSCFTARAIYLAGNHAKSGLPVVEWDGEGFSRQLVDFSEGEMTKGVFDLPEGYSHYSPGAQ